MALGKEKLLTDNHMHFLCDS